MRADLRVDQHAVLPARGRLHRPDVTRRGTDVAGRAVWSLADLQELLDEWIICWQTRPHEGLRHPFTPGRAASPNEVYAALVAAAGLRAGRR